MTDRVLIEVQQNNGFRDGDYSYRGYLIGISQGSGYDGGGYKKHEGLWLVLSHETTGTISSEPAHRCREVRDPTT